MERESSIFLNWLVKMFSFVTININIKKSKLVMNFVANLITRITKLVLIEVDVYSSNVL